MHSSESILFLFTIDFPFGNEDKPFMDDELRILSGHFKKIIVFPWFKRQVKSHPLPPNAETVFLFENIRYSKNKAVRKDFFRYLYLLAAEVARLHFNNGFFRNFSNDKSYLLQLFSRSYPVEDYIRTHGYENVCFYSYWFNEWATVLAILKMKKSIPGFFCRAHGFDLFEERWEGGFIPFRNFQLRMADNIFSVSETGTRYLKARYPLFANRIKTSRLGVESMEHADFVQNAPFTILSCSALIPLKRVHLIADALALCDFPARWIHIGNGTEMETIRKKVHELPSHIITELKGYLSKEQIATLYKNTNVNLFLHVSETEGLPVVLMEAASCGIPLMSCDAGGVHEIVNNETGVLLPKNISPENLAGEIKKFKNSEKNNAAFRAGVKSFQKKHFSADRNYSMFAREIIKTNR